MKPRDDGSGSRDSPYVFIIGSARTGSTLLLTSLNLHPRVSIIGEMKFHMAWGAYDIMDLARDCNSGGSAEFVKSFIQGIKDCEVDAEFWRNVRDGTATFEFDQLKAQMEGDAGADYNILRSILQVHRSTTGVNLAGAKLPVSIRNVPRLYANFPDALYLHTVRDARASASSHANRFHAQVQNRTRMKLPRRISYNLLILHKIIDYNLAARLHLSLRSKSNYQMVRFEDLVTDPQDTLQRICDHTGIEYDESMLNVNPVNTAYDESEYDSGFDTGALHRWESKLPTLHRRLVETLTGRAMSTFGYGPVNGR